MQWIDQTVETISALNSFALKLSVLPICYYPLNFIFPFIASYITFLFHIATMQKKDVMTQIMFIQGLEKDRAFQRALRKTSRQYGIVTGIAACALISLQFREVNIIWAIICGLLGPYAVRDRLFQSFEKNVVNSSINKVNDTIQSVEEETKPLIAKLEESIKEQLNIKK